MAMPITLIEPGVKSAQAKAKRRSQIPSPSSYHLILNSIPSTLHDLLGCSSYRPWCLQAIHHPNSIIINNERYTARKLVGTN